MDLVFQSHPEVVIGSNTFRNVPTILQYEDTPLIEVGKFEPAGFGTRVAVFHNDGTKIAVVRGSQIYLTDEGKKASVTQRFEAGLTVCELEGKPIFELRRTGAAALKGWAELYAPEGVFIKARDAGIAGIISSGEAIHVGGVVLSGSIFDGHNVGIRVTRTSISLGGSGGKSMKATVGNYTVTATGGGKIILGPGTTIKAPDGESR